MNKTVTKHAAASIVILLLMVGIFYGGMKYGQSKSSFNPQTMASGQGRQFGQGGRTVGNNANRAGAGFINGSIIAQDDKSITVKSQDGGSKIIWLAGSTQITKSASGTISDLSKDTQVLANGTTNTDGSITATFIQIRPQGINENRPMGATPANTNQPKTN